VRAIRTTTISILAVGLLAGSAVGVSAQDEEAAADVPAGSSYFTGTYTPVGTPVAGGSVTTGPDGLTQMLGEVYAGETIETSDPRVSGSLSRVVNRAEARPGLWPAAEAWRLENEGGSWTGQGTSLVHSVEGIKPSSWVTMVLSGEGVYEGLTAVVLVDRIQVPHAVEGAVIAGEPVPVPEPPAE